MKITTNQLMKSLLIVPALLWTLPSTAKTNAASAKPKAAELAGTFKVDSTHSKVGFEISHLVISSVEGRFTSFDGQIDLDKEFPKSKVTANVDLNTVDTGVKDRDTHLKSADFFDVEKHPQMKFVSTSIVGKKDSFKLIGDLTIKGVTKKVTFDSKFLGVAKDAYGNEKAAFTAKTKINRKDFGLTWSKMVEVGPVVGDEVTIELKIQGGRPAPEKAAEQK